MKTLMRGKRLIAVVAAIGAGAILVTGAVALFTGDATSSNNTVTADPEANIQLSLDNTAFGGTADDALAATFSTGTETIQAGHVDVRNANDTGDDWVNGYDLANSATVGGAAEDIALDAELLVSVATTTAGTACEATAAGGAQAVIVTSQTFSAGSSIISDRGALNTSNTGSPPTERLCFYLELDGAPNTVAEGSVTYALTFTAD